MATNKKSVLLYCDIIHTVKELSDDEAGLLFKHYLEYINDLNPEPPNKLIKIVFEPIKQNLKRDLKKWESKSNGFSEAGKTSVKAKRLINEPQLYIIKLYNDNEEFIKVGITDQSVSRRFRSSGDGMSKLGYKFDVLYQYFKSDYNTSLVDVECAVGKNFSHKQYMPLNKFGGYLECYHIDSLVDIKTFCDKTFNEVKQRSTISTVKDKVIDTVKDKVIVKDKETNSLASIPEFDDFLNYALEHKPNINQDLLKLKYEAWKANNWKTGGKNSKPIKNWKSTLLNTLPYIQENSNANMTPQELTLLANKQAAYDMGLG